MHVQKLLTTASYKRTYMVPNLRCFWKSFAGGLPLVGQTV